METSVIIKTSSQADELDSFEKGAQFQDFIVRLFNERYFILDKHRKSERTKDPEFLMDCGKPDLEMIFSRRQRHHFAVECKWRRGFYNQSIRWAEEHQIKSYRDFENQRRMPVFVAIGIGGQPSNPEKLFVTPLRNIEMYTDVYETDLILYERKATRRFFFDTTQGKLF